MGLAVVFTALALYAVYVLLYLSDVYNVYIFDKLSQDMRELVKDELEFDYIISKSFIDEKLSLSSRYPF